MENFGVLRYDHYELLQEKWTRLFTFYPLLLCRLIINLLYPYVVKQHVFSMPCGLIVHHSHRPKIVSGFPCMPINKVLYEVGARERSVSTLVHRLLDRNEWKGRSEAFEVIRKEKEGLL